MTRWCLARFEKVHVKASAVPCYTHESYPFTGFKPHLQRVFEHFGPRRMHWGSDVSRLPCTYRQAVTHFVEELDFLGDEELALVMGGGLSEVLG